MHDSILGGRSDRQLPIGNEIFLDHVGHFVPDAAAARDALARAGFAPTPVSIQVDPRSGAPTGTGNTTAMLTRGYIEALFRTADTPLGREFDAALARHAGVHLVAFSVSDGAVAHRQLAASGFRVRPLVAMQRPVETETGAGTAAFTVARVEPDAMAEGRIQILQHHTENEVWQKRWLVHPNGTLALAGLIVAVADVEEATERFMRFTGRDAAPCASGRTVALDRGHVHVVSPEGFAALLPDVAVPRIPFIGAYGLVVASLDAMRNLFARAGLAAHAIGAAVAVRFPEELGQGAWLFAERAADFPWIRPCGHSAHEPR